MCRETEIFIETTTYYWCDQLDIDINEDVLSVIIKYTLTKDMKENFKENEFSNDKFIRLKIVIEGSKSVGKSCFLHCLQQFITTKADDVSIKIRFHENEMQSDWRRDICDHAENSAYRPPPDIIFILFEAPKYEQMLSDIKEWAEYVDGMCVPTNKYIKCQDLTNKQLLSGEYIKKCETQCIIVGTKLDQLSEMNLEYESEEKLEKICEKIWEKCDQHKRIHFGGFVSSTTKQNINIVFFEAIKRLLNSTDIESCIVCGSHFEPRKT